jgi:hypothetical protein
MATLLVGHVGLWIAVASASLNTIFVAYEYDQRFRTLSGASPGPSIGPGAMQCDVRHELAWAGQAP